MLTLSNAEAIGISLQSEELTFLNVREDILKEALEVLGDDTELGKVIRENLEKYERHLLGLLDFNNTCKSIV